MTPDTVEPIFCSIDEAAKMLGIGKNTLRRLLESRQIRSAKMGTRVLVRLDSLRAFVDSI